MSLIGLLLDLQGWKAELELELLRWSSKMLEEACLVSESDDFSCEFLEGSSAFFWPS